MKAFVATNVLGTFAFDDNGTLLEYVLFKKDPEFIAERLNRTKKNDVIEEEVDVLKKLQKRGIKEIGWNKEAQPKGIDMICTFQKDNPAEEALSYSYRKFAIQFKWVTTQAEINEVLTKVNVLLTKTQLKIAKKDKILMQAVSVLDEMEKDLNIFTEHMREWYGLYFPESIKYFDSNEKFVNFVADVTLKENIEDEKLAKNAKISSGMPFGEDDMEEIKAFAKITKELYSRKEKLSKYVEASAKAIIPNISAIAGPVLGARMLALAGGMDKISSMASSTVQLLGAEKALFRHLKGQGKAPKYGILFGHPYIQNAPKHLRGKAARLIAAKISIAARIDKFSKEDRGAEMKKQLDVQIARLK
jgi:nucleolar protein 56